MEKFKIKSREVHELINIDDLLLEAIEKSKVTDGVAVIYTPHTTAAITINENADPDVCSDFLYGLQKISPNLAEYQHYEGNSAAHIKSSLVGCSETVLISDGKPVFGTWQSLYFAEFDGPRTRMVLIDIR